MLLRTGIDLLEIQRMQSAQQRFGRKFLDRIFTSREIADVGVNSASLAARFAAKEAVAKALGTGIGIISWQDIEIVRGAAREPVLHLHGMALQIAHELGLTTWSLSLSHSASHAIAFVVAIS